MRTDVKTDIQTYMTKLIVALRSFTKVPKSGKLPAPSLRPKCVMLF